MMKRRDFVKYGATGLAAIVMGPKLGWLMDDPAYASNLNTTGVINLVVTDAVKEMVTFNDGLLANRVTRVGPGSPATCFFWIFQDADQNFNTFPTAPTALPADCPGPIIFATTGQTITVNVKNLLNEPHAFSIPQMGRGVTTGSILPGATGQVKFQAGPAGTYLYYDNLNTPVNRVMGLHGAFIVMPGSVGGTRAGSGHRITPYDRPTPNVQKLFDDLGHASWWPGLAWEEGDASTDTPPFRQNIWLMHQASPHLFEEVGLFSQTHPGSLYPASTFVSNFLHDPINAGAPTDPATGWPANHTPQYFTLSGQSGHFAHNNPWICPYSRVGEPYLIRLLNAGLWLHSTHIHANHVFILQHNNRSDVFPGSFDNPIWVDVYTSAPLDTYDWLIPYMRPPDVPNNLGIGRDDLEQSLDVSGTAVPMPGYGLAPGGPPFVAAQVDANPPPLPGTTGHLTWPPLQEVNMFIPNVGTRTTLAQDGVTVIDCAVRLSPVCFPMHDHSEPSQVANGGNYNCGLISGIVFTGDRKGARPGQASKVITFPDRPNSADTIIDPLMIAHGPDMEPHQKGALPASPPFKMPSLP